MKKEILVSIDSTDYINHIFSGKLYICGCMEEKNGTVITIPKKKLAKPSGKSVYWDLKKFTFILITTIICWKMQE
jgi:hypothetical protein